MKKVAALSLVACLGLIAGCHKQDPLVGTWNGTNKIGVTEQALTLTVAGDGTYKEIMVSSRPNLKTKLVATDTGTWKNLSEGKYNFKLVDTNWTTEGASAKQEARMQERFKARKAEIIANSNKEPSTEITWEGNDKFTLREGKMTESFTRSQ